MTKTPRAGLAGRLAATLKLPAMGTLRFASLANSALHLITVAMSFATYWLMLRLTGAAVVGCWTMIFGLVGMARLADMGLANNITRFLASEADLTRKTYRSLSAVVGLVCYVPMALGAAVIAVPTYFYAAGRADLPVTRDELLTLTLIAIVSTLVGAITLVLAALGQGRGRMVIAGFSSFIYNAMALTLMVPCVWAWGAVGIAIANLVGLVAQMALLGTGALKDYLALPRSHGKGLGPRALIGRLRNSSLQSFATVLAAQGLDPLTRIFVVQSSGFAVQALFEMALRVSGQTSALIGAATQPLLYVGASNRDNLAQRFATPHEILIVFVRWTLIALVAGSPILSVMIFERISWEFIAFLSLIGTGHMMWMAGATGKMALSAHGRFGAILAITTASAGVNLVLGLLLSQWIGAVGAVMALGIGYVVSGGLMLREWRRLSGRPNAATIFQLAPAFTTAVSLAVGFVAAAFLGEGNWNAEILFVSIVASGLCGILGLRLLPLLRGTRQI